VRLFPSFLLLLSACSQSDAASEEARSACAARLFEGSRFTVCQAKGGKVEVRTSGASGPYRSFSALQAALGKRADKVAFAMNAGMFDESGKAIGLLVEDGKQLRAINRRKGGGNFHLMPNGVFLVRRHGSADVVTSKAYAPSKDILFATQSGPMLVIDGKLHTAFDRDGSSKHFRNGVGIGPDGTPVFVISADPVSFGKFARFYRDSVKAKNALFFDGAVSSLWDPAAHRMDSHAPLGPIVVVFRP
jgi:uncharacterized protein YigE (DUF2233 family)